jgi:hypothetical protein
VANNPIKETALWFRKNPATGLECVCDTTLHLAMSIAPSRPSCQPNPTQPNPTPWWKVENNNEINELLTKR